MTNNEAVAELQRLAEIEHSWHYQSSHEQGGDATYPVSFCDAIAVSMGGVTSPTGKECTCGAADNYSPKIRALFIYPQLKDSTLS